MRNGCGTVGSISGGSHSAAMETLQSPLGTPPSPSTSEPGSLDPAIAPPERRAAPEPAPGTGTPT